VTPVEVRFAVHSRSTSGTDTRSVESSGQLSWMSVLLVSLTSFEK
jgi:hypothetical protein